MFILIEKKIKILTLIFSVSKCIKQQGINLFQVNMLLKVSADKLFITSSILSTWFQLEI